MKTIRGISVEGKTAVVRADYNVPVSGGEIADDYRIQKNIPTLQYLLEKGCRLVIVSHLGRPDGEYDWRYSLTGVMEVLETQLDRPVDFASDFDQVDSANTITLCENLRFHPGEEANDRDFAQQIARLGDVFVQDGFGVVHRAHASTDAVTEFLPSAAGLLLEEEVRTITETMDNPDRPLIAIMGGAKVSDKIELMRRMVSRADRMIIGGAMANTFLKYHGYDIGASTYEDGQEATIADIYQQAAKKRSEGNMIWLPEDGVYVGKTLDTSARSQASATDQVGAGDYILDDEIPGSVLDEIKNAGTVIWNGPLGMTEFPDFTHGSRAVAEAIKASSAKSVVGGGDTAGFVQQHGLLDHFDWVSTGGGAALDLMAGKELPGLIALPD
ncbi:phosphoglycerate kinase [Candidatus Saccharibacteria bacterium QS_5_54_17]|nr:MAG: phosphoglycerate kinase [Candidatus Saccharibacteria bacterium QS_5_54_17]